MLRSAIQIAFLALTLTGVFVFGANCEKWCPFGGVESLYTYVNEGALTCSLAVSNFYILGAVLLMTLLVGRAFCGYACPLGTIGRLCGMAGKRVQKTLITIPQPWDTVLSMLKYIIAVVILYLTWTTGELIFRAVDPCYALLSRHGEDITVWAYIVSGILIVASFFISLPFCRWLCPLAAILNLPAIFSRFRIVRNEGTCIRCGKCAQNCPMAIPVDRSIGESIERCLACTECVCICPQNTGEVKTLQSSFSQRTVIAVLLICLLSAVLVYAMFPLASFTKVRGDRPEQTESVTLKVDHLTCRGTANRLWFYLDRDDLYALPGYVFVEVWADPKTGTVRITFDPALVSRDDLCRAITEPYINFADATSPGQIMFSPFVIHGYNPMEEGNEN